MKKYIKSDTYEQNMEGYDLERMNREKIWPSPQEWWNVDGTLDEFEDLWFEYLANPEDRVNKELQIFVEPSVQGSMGGMFIFDESGEDRESFSIDFQDWCDRELDMAAESQNQSQYMDKYRAFVQNLIDENWR